MLATQSLFVAEKHIERDQHQCEKMLNVRKKTKRIHSRMTHHMIHWGLSTLYTSPTSNPCFHWHLSLLHFTQQSAMYVELLAPMLLATGCGFPHFCSHNVLGVCIVLQFQVSIWELILQKEMDLNKCWIGQPILSLYKLLNRESIEFMISISFWWEASTFQSIATEPLYINSTQFDPLHFLINIIWVTQILVNVSLTRVEFQWNSLRSNLTY